MFDRFLKSVLMDADPAPAGGDPGAGADPKPGAFDPAAFKADILGEFNKTLNGFAKTMKNDFSKLFPPKPADPAPSDPPADPKPGDPKADPEKNALALELKRTKEEFQKKFDVLEKSKVETEQKAEKTDREAKIRSELSKYTFASDSARETAFRLFSSDVSRSEEGALVANDLPFDKYIESELPAKHAYLLAPKDVGGAGARTGKAAGGKKWDLDRDLKPENFSKLSSADQAELRQYIANSLR